MSAADDLIANAKAARSEGNLAEAAALYRKAAQLLPEDPLRYAHAIRHAGDILRKLNHYESADSCFTEVLAIYRRHPTETLPLDLANAIRGYACLAQDRGQMRHAASLWQQALDLYQQCGIDAGVQEAKARLEHL